MKRQAIALLLLTALPACQSGSAPGPAAAPPATAALASPAASTAPMASTAPAASTAPVASAAPAASAPASPQAFSPPDAEAIRLAFRGEGYVKINASPKVGNSAHSGPMNLHVSREAAALYAKGSQASFPAGSVVVKASEGSDGKQGTFAVMVKLPAGTDPEAGDWWYYEAINGSVVYGGAQGGGFCNRCHQGLTPDRLGGIPLFAP